MELRNSSPKRDISPPDNISNPEEKEISEDEDDDRNHKHRRRDDDRSESLERDTLEPVFNKPYRKRKPYENGGNVSHSNEPWKNYNKRNSNSNQGSVRGRGREGGFWGPRGSRFGHGSMGGSNMFSGRGVVPHNSQSTSWSTYGMANGGLDSLHPMHLQGPLIQPMNMGIPLQRCRDFEERGFCLRGDMCPMEHGVNRIVVEDVQSLSQFNLPVSLPSAHLLGPTTGQGPVPAITVNSTTLNKNPVSKSNKPGINGDNIGLNEVLIDESITAGTDIYDPDQPLWSKDGPEKSSLHLSDGFDNLKRVETTQPQSSWGKISNSKNRLEKEKAYSVNESKEDQRKQITESSSRPGSSVRKPSQKALRTLFVNGIPQNDNKKEGLLAHFQKFGEVIDIYIPLNTSRAFVQFSKREEAESAMKSPDAVMGNRFVKLWWANRDNIPDDTITSTVKENSHSVVKNYNAHSYIPSTGPGPNNKLMVSDGPKVPISQKKSETLELLKEEIRKKQELLDQKRNEFRKQLDKLEKQGTGPKEEQASSPVVKKPKVETIESTGPGVITEPVPQSLENIIVPQGPKSTSNMAVQESMAIKPLIHPLAHVGLGPGPPFTVNRFKLDNRPTSFKIVPPLPTGLANVAVLKEHFSSYGDLSTVELENEESETLITAKICFNTRRPAERAFSGGKIWKGHTLQFKWAHKDSPSTSYKLSPDATVKLESGDSEKKENSGSGDPENDKNAESEKKENSESGDPENDKNAESEKKENSESRDTENDKNAESGETNLDNVESEKKISP